MSDALLIQTKDGGDLELGFGRVELTDGFETMVYLAMFGSEPGWWGNAGETDAARQIKGETLKLMGGLPRTVSSLRRLEDAARLDLQVFIDERIANKVDVAARDIGNNQIELLVDIVADGQEDRFAFVENWRISGESE